TTWTHPIIHWATKRLMVARAPRAATILVLLRCQGIRFAILFSIRFPSGSRGGFPSGNALPPSSSASLSPISHTVFTRTSHGTFQHSEIENEFTLCTGRRPSTDRSVAHSPKRNH